MIYRNNQTMTLICGALAMLGASSQAWAQVSSPDFCESTIGVCIYTSMDAAPVYADDVCWDGTYVTFVGLRGCISPSSQYTLAYGYVEPATREIVPLVDTCDLGYCSPDEVHPGTTLGDGVACCNPKTKVCNLPDQKGGCSVGDITWCKKIDNHGDGTITCHE